jgi:acyl carrier protein
MAVKDDVIEIIEDQLGVDASQITDDASFTEDLGADSLDLAELVMAFEEDFDIEISEEAAEQIGTVGEAVEQIEAQL